MLGEKIKELRVEKGFTQEDLAKLVEINFTYVAKIEGGNKVPSVKVLHKLASALEADLDELLILAYMQGKIDTDELRKTIQNNPKIGLIVKSLQNKEISPEKIDRILELLDD